MKKTLFFVLSLILLCSCKHNTGKDIMLAHISFPGNVGQITVTDYRILPDGQLGPKVWNGVYKYNKEGLLSDFACYAGDGSLTWRYVYIYDGTLLLSELDYGGDGSLLWQHDYHYDADSLQTDFYTYDNSGEIYRFTAFAYDSLGQRNLLCSFFPDGSFASKESYRYDSNGNKTEQLIYSSDSIINEATFYTYDAEGRLLSERRTDVNGNLWDEYRYTYQEGRLAASQSYDAEGQLFEQVKVCYSSHDLPSAIAFKPSSYPVAITSDPIGNPKQITIYEAKK